MSNPRAILSSLLTVAAAGFLDPEMKVQGGGCRGLYVAGFKK